MPTYEVPNGPTLAYDDTGGDGPAVVLAHGLLMSREMFAPQVEELAGDYRCVSWNQRGHGDTEWEGPFSYWDSARDLIALCGHLELRRPVFVGMSQGGYTSLRACLLEPGLARGLVLIDSRAGLEDESMTPMYEAMAADWAANGLAPETAELIADIILGDIGGRDYWTHRWQTEVPLDQVPFPLRALLDREDLGPRLGEIRTPSLVIHGDADAAIPMEAAEDLCSGLPACRGLVKIPGGSHASNLSHPAEVNAALLTFLADLDASER